MSDKKTKEDKMNQSLLTPAALAIKLNVPKSWLYFQVRNGGPDSIPSIRLGKYIRFDESEVLEWLKKRKVSG